MSGTGVWVVPESLAEPLALVEVVELVEVLELDELLGSVDSAGPVGPSPGPVEEPGCAGPLWQAARSRSEASARTAPA